MNLEALSFGLGVKQRVATAERNRYPIAELLKRVLPDSGLVLEIGSGSGQHAVHFAREMPYLEWQPSDYDQVAVASIEAYRADSRLKNLREAQLLEARSRTWGKGYVDAVVCINMVQSTGWAVTEGLFDGARRHLGMDGLLVVYGPFKQNGGFKSQSDEELDAKLRARSPYWGLRDLEAVAALGMARSLEVEQVVDMPDGDLALVFRKIAKN